jgi:hypothetical protein
MQFKSSWSHEQPEVSFQCFEDIFFGLLLIACAFSTYSFMHFFEVVNLRPLDHVGHDVANA